MTTTQLFFAIAGLMVTLTVAVLGIVLALFYKYLDAKFEAIDKQLKFLVEHVVDHCAKIAMLEERTKKP